MKKGLKRFFIFLFLGISVGFYIKLENYLAKEILILLAEEIKQGTASPTTQADGCDLKYRKASISLITLNAEVKDAKVVCSNRPTLTFEKIFLDASWRSILKKTIEFDHLRLIGADAFGVSPKSATYQFIDYLTKPSEPDAKPTLIKFLTHKITVEDSFFQEELGRNVLIAKGVDLTLTYNQNRDAILAPTIKELDYVIRGDGIPSTLPLGSVSGDIQIADDTTFYHKLLVSRDKNSISAKAQETIGAENSLTGQVELNTTLQYLGLPDWLTGSFTSKSTMTGEISSPVISGPLSLPKDLEFGLFPGGIKVISVKNLSGSYKVDVNDGDPIVEIDRLQGDSSDATVKLNSPIKIIDGNLSGQLELKTDSIVVNTIEFKGVSAKVDLSGPLEKVKASITGDMESALALGANIRNISFKAENEDQFFLVNAQQKKIPSGGSLSLTAKIDLDKPQPEIAESNFTFANYPFSNLFQPSPTPEAIDLLRISGSGSAEGQFDPTKIKVSAQAKLVSSAFGNDDFVNAEMRIENGELKIDTQNSAKTQNFSSFFMGLTEENKLSTLKVNFRKDSLPKIYPQWCSTIDGTLNLDFPEGIFAKANGELDLNDFKTGCEETAISLKQPVKIIINDGIFGFKNLLLTSFQNQLQLNGIFAPFGSSNLEFSGDIPLYSLRNILPTIDDLSGVISTNAFFEGTLNSPNIKGEAKLVDAAIGLESSQISLQKLKGSLLFNGKAVTTSNLTGELNGGEFSLNGEYILDRPHDSKLTIKSENMAFNPTAGLAVSANADITLMAKDNSPSLDGTITITSAEFEKRLDITTLARSVVDLIFASREPLKLESSANAPEIPLSIKIQANRNIFAITNFFGAEARGELLISGNMQAPVISGEIEALNGWFGLRERRFNLTSGSVIFDPRSPVPTLSVLGETLVRSNAGDILNVYLEATGPITSPKIVLSSDTGLSQNDILNLLTSSGQVIQQTLINQVGGNEPSAAFSLIDMVPLLNYSSFLRYLGQIDSISIEPQFNIQSGLIEPTVTATKKLSNSVYLFGQGFLGSQVTETRLGAVYNILPYLNLQALLMSVSDQPNVALEVNSAVTLLAQRKQNVNFTIDGNQTLRGRTILGDLNLNTSSKVMPEEMLNIRQGIKRLYRRAGYFDARILSTCRVNQDFCNSIEFNITEGSVSLINTVTVEDNDSNSSNKIPEELLPYDSINKPASAEVLINTRTELIKWLRTNGFLAARVEASYALVPNQPLQRELHFKVYRGRPIKFNFSGNKAFDAETFLDTINIHGRKVPFGANTGRILAESIDQLYRESGYLDVEVSQERATDADGSEDTINIYVNEGIRYKPNGSDFAGLVLVNKEDLIRRIKALGREPYISIVNPDTLLLESLQIRSRDIQRILIDQGFAQANIEIDFERNAERKTAKVIYKIFEGERQTPFKLLPNIIVANGDNDLSFIPSVPDTDMYQTKLDQYKDEVVKSLFEAGYRSPTLNLIRKDFDTLAIEIIPDELTQSGDITFTGLDDISEDYLREIIGVKKGESLSLQKIRTLRHKLLSQGLFARVDIKETDTDHPLIKNVEISLEEKPLTTLDIGGGYNTEFGVHLFGEAVDRSLFKDGRSLSLRLDAYVNSPSGETISRGIAALKYTSPSIFDSKYTLTEDLRYQKFNSTVYEFDLDRTSLSSSIYRNWDSGISLTMGHTLLSEDLSNVKPDVVIGPQDRGSVFLSYLGTSLSYDKRDNPLNPNSGYNLTWDGKLSLKEIGSDADFAGTGLRATHLYPFSVGFNNFTFAKSIRGAVSRSNSDEKYVPISQRYYLGGRSTVRGYAENKLGPRGTEGGILGGQSLLAGSLELQYRLLDSLSLNTFFDAGNVFLNSYDQLSNGVPQNIIDQDDRFLNYSAGFGLRFLSPIGPIGLDIGFPIDRRDIDDPWRVHFNIGSNF